MAPKTRGASSSAAGKKRKRTDRQPAREPTPDSSPDDSPAPAPSSLVDRLADRVITTGRKVDFELFENEGLFVGRQLIEMGFEKLCSLDCPTYPSLVKEFYKNLSRGDNGLTSSVRGKCLNVSVPILSRLLDLPCRGPSTFEPEDRAPALLRLLNREFENFEEVHANLLPLDLRLLHNICSRILFPKTGRFDHVSERDIFVMDAIISKKPFNLPQMMIWYIADCGSKRKSSLPYGMILTKLFLSQGIMISESEPVRNLRHTDYYGLATLHRMGFVKANGIWERKSQNEERTAELGASAPSEAGPSVRHPSPVPRRAESSRASRPSSSSIPNSSSFSENQMDQLRSLLIEQNAELRNEISQLKNEMIQMKEDQMKLKEDIISKIEKISLSIRANVSTLRVDLNKIFEKMTEVVDKSKIYVDKTNLLRRDINEACDHIQDIMKDFSKSQKDDFMEIIGHLKSLVFKYTK